MKTKIILILQVILLLLSPFSSKADEQDAEKVIPLNMVFNGNERNNRNLILNPIECCYYGSMNLIRTTVCNNLGKVIIEINNTTTGENWNYIFDSSSESIVTLPISSTDGLYNITYTTESGCIYAGTLIIE